MPIHTRLDDLGPSANLSECWHDVRSAGRGKWNFGEWGQVFPADVPLDRANPGDFDALLLAGGVTNPDSLRMLPMAVAFAKGFFDTGKPVAVICHGAPNGDRDWLREGKEDCFMPLRPGILQVCLERRPRADVLLLRRNDACRGPRLIKRLTRLQHLNLLESVSN